MTDEITHTINSGQLSDKVMISEVIHCNAFHSLDYNVALCEKHRHGNGVAESCVYEYRCDELISADLLDLSEQFQQKNPGINFEIRLNVNMRRKLKRNETN